MQKGKIKWFNPDKEFGFIELSHGRKDVFVHISTLEGIGTHQIYEGMRVQFEVIKLNGKSQAQNVKRIG